MKMIIVISILTFFIARNLQAQEQPEIPKPIFNPDFLPATTKILDSVVQYTMGSSGDSAYLRKWKYPRIEKGNICESVMYNWNLALREWSAPRSRYVYGVDPQGRQYLQEHYTYMYSNGTWKGCDSEGCGKRGWDWDESGNLILRTQYYWNSDMRVWRLNNQWEYVWDKTGNIVLEASMNIDAYSGYWVGGKNEYSYDSHGFQIGHVFYEWAGWDPYDWYPQYKVERSYDGNGNMEMFATEIWREGKWIGGYLYGYYGVKWAKAEWKHDSNGKKTSVLLYLWDNNLNKWVADLKEDNKYDAKGRPISEMVLNFDNGDGREFFPQRKEYSYDTAGFKISEITSTWGNLYGPANWGNPIKEEYTYEAGKKIMMVHCHWNSETKSWQKSDKIGYKYDPAGNLIEQVAYIWSDEIGEWRPESKEVFAFNGLGKQVLNARYIWSLEKEQLIAVWKKEIMFDLKGRLILESYYQWDSGLDNWVGTSNGWNQVESRPGPGKTEYGYDDSGNLILHASYMWDRNLNDWIGYNVQGCKKEWGYDSKGQVFLEIRYDWVTNLKHWEKVSKNVLIYDDTGDPSFQNQYAWNPDLSDWEIILRSFYYYRSSVSGTTEISAVTISIWPNPTAGVININGLSKPTEVQLYSIQGQLLKTVQQVESSVDVTDMPAGVYILQLTMGQERVIRKILIDK